MLRFSVSSMAIDVISKMCPRSEPDDELVLRIDIVGGAPSGFAYDLYFTRPEPNDEIIAIGQIKLAMRPDTARYLDDGRIDWVECDNGAGFVISGKEDRL